ncbi:amino acid permease [Rossellomorea aquimaris]|uniref:amino acid permease n=1 Tax=Rossellomorea aquimaris TaxID=189382 RepID=UPI001CD64684|nr:amino acid permease [Rossellomorea aquimaris]MCA1053726.1 amino acid permease [Rossellomorea aquimaris]
MSDQYQSCKQTKRLSTSGQGKMSWWHLSLLGTGCTIGTGYFLGSAIGIRYAGPSIVLSFILAALGTYTVYNLLGKMTAEDPQEGSFCYYAAKAFGKWAGFSCGWNYWCSNILIMGSQLTALSILSQFWFPHIPLWMFASGYAVLSLLIVFLGTESFDRAENIFALIKTAAIIMFIIVALLAITGTIEGSGQVPHFSFSLEHSMPEGLKGFWSSLIYAFYAYGGIEVIGLMAMQLKDKKDAPKSGNIMLLVLTIIYSLSLVLAVVLTAHEAFNDKESPFVSALSLYNLPFFPHVFNGAIIIAGFSALTASLFGVTNLLVTLSKDGDAPKIFQKKWKAHKDLPLPSLALATLGLVASVITALLLPGKVFEYITTAAGILLLYNWAFIIISAFKVLRLRIWGKILGITGLLLLSLAVTGTLLEPEVRYGFFLSLLLVSAIAVVAYYLNRKWKRDDPFLHS